MLRDHMDGVVPADENSWCSMSDEMRQDERIDDPIPGTVRHVGRNSKVMIRNLSARGAMADGIFDISIGQSVSVRIGRGGWIKAKVAWAITPRCGLEFQSVVDPATAHDGNWVT
jgi:hypothetical protein